MQSHGDTVIHYITQANGSIDHLESLKFICTILPLGSCLLFYVTQIQCTLCVDNIYTIYTIHTLSLLLMVGWQVVNGEVL